MKLLAGNAISKIGPHALEGKRSLKMLYIQNNHLTTEKLHSLAFKNLSNLEEINLSNNYLEEIPDLPNSVEMVSKINNNDHTYLLTDNMT